MIWLNLLIPLVTSIVLLLFFQKKVVWWEFLILFGITPIVILICGAGGESSVVRDMEYWGSFAKEANYYEAWDEEVSCQHPIYENQQTGTDSKGNATYSQVYVGNEHLYDVDYHYEEWSVRDNTGNEQSISKEKFNELSKRWNNKSFVDMKRDYHQEDGDMYKTIFDGKDETLEPLVCLQSYRNRVQASNSVFNFPKVEDPDSYGLYNYPRARLHNYPTFNINVPSILGNCPKYKEANRILDIANSRLGSRKQIRIWMLVYKDKPLETGIQQENYWKGGNKNELVVCVGLDKENNVTWCRPFSWTEKDIIKTTIKNEVSGMGKFDAVKVAELTVEQVKKNWVRKEFKDFDYLEVELPSWVYWMTFGVTLLVNIGLALFVVLNGINERNNKSSRRL